MEIDKKGKILNSNNLSSYKTVLLHDWLTGFRGGERVLEAFCEIFPQSPLFTLIYQKNSTSPIIEGRSIHSSFLNSIPGMAKHYRKFLPLFPLACSGLKVDPDVKLMLSSSHCVIKGAKRPKGAVHVSYLHSPMRYIYDQFDIYFGKDAPSYQRLGAKIFKNYLTRWDQESNSQVDFLIANSHFVGERIRKYYGREFTVIHPFVDTHDFRFLHTEKKNEEKENYYLMLTAFAPNKRVDLAISAFNRWGKTLKIIGSGQNEKELRQMANKNIQFLGNLSRQEVISALAKAKALVFPGIEDFGITPLEALAAGTPVVAFGAGGVLETLDSSVAEFFMQAEVDSLLGALEEMEERSRKTSPKKFSTEKMFSRAEEFSKEKFIEKIQTTLKNIL